MNNTNYSRYCNRYSCSSYLLILLRFYDTKFFSSNSYLFSCSIHHIMKSAPANMAYTPFFLSMQFHFQTCVVQFFLVLVTLLTGLFRCKGRCCHGDRNPTTIVEDDKCCDWETAAVMKSLMENLNNSVLVYASWKNDVSYYLFFVIVAFLRLFPPPAYHRLALG